jgi:pantoate--beta-alanine ligase
MKIIRSVKSMQSFSRQMAAKGKTVAVVPTMGYLHEGHLALVLRARKEADVVVTSIFVNPAQFAPSEDLAKYPRDEKRDLRLIETALGKASKNAAVFIPKAEDMYPDDFQTWVTVEKLTTVLEGAQRPTHFRGVTTIVAKLFNIIRPDIAVFGQKDFQQAVVLRRMTQDLGYPVKYIVAPTVREEDGLAKSSRNAYFDEQGRWEAVALYYALQSAQEMVKAGISAADPIMREMQAVIRATAPTAEIDYIAFNDAKTLEARPEITQGTVCSLAVRIRGVRLIDNLKLK